jgi:GNAT superfamily N-acetyltransferase
MRLQASAMATATLTADARRKAEAKWRVHGEAHVDAVRRTDRIDGYLTDEYQLRYGDNDEMTAVDAEEFDPPAGTCLVLVDGGSVAAGGGVRRVSADSCGVKRMWTAAVRRRKGHASRVLTSLEDTARAAGYSTLLLEADRLQAAHRPAPAGGRGQCPRTAHDHAHVRTQTAPSLPGRTCSPPAGAAS